MAMLPRARYRDVFEPGCSVGVLSELLAPRCERLLCCDIAPAAVQSAAQRTAAHPNVVVQQRALPGDWPAGQFDLIVLSETLYYFAGPDLDEILNLTAPRCAPTPPCWPCTGGTPAPACAFPAFAGRGGGHAPDHDPHAGGRRRGELLTSAVSVGHADPGGSVTMTGWARARIRGSMSTMAIARGDHGHDLPR